MSRAYNSVIIQLLAAVVCAHIVRSALRSSSQLQSSGDATGMVIARRMYFLRQHCGQYVASPSSSRTSPGRRSVVRRFLVTCLGEADEIFRRLYAQLRELGWVDQIG